MITPIAFRRIFPKCKDVAIWTAALNAAAQEFSIDTPARLAAWCAQCAHESQELRALRENLSYSASGLMKTWPRRFPSEAYAIPYARQPQRLANAVYANRLGNGPPESNDGWTYRGGGIIQLTGRANYKAAGEALGLPLETQPGRIEQPPVAARAAAWFWSAHGLNELADAGDFDRITETINGPAKLGLEARKAYWETAKAALGVSA